MEVDDSGSSGVPCGIGVDLKIPGDIKKICIQK